MSYSSRDIEPDNRDYCRERVRTAVYRGRNDGPARSSRSPPLVLSSSRISMREVGRTVRDMAERRSRREGSAGGSECLSVFYRDHFGDHSPEDYRNLRLSQFDRTLAKNNIRSILEDEFKHMTPFEIKIVTDPEDSKCLAYVNFSRPDCAKAVRRTMVPRLQKVLGKRIMLDPAGVIRDQGGKYIPDRYNRAAMSATELERSPEAHSSRSDRRSPPSTTKVSNFSGTVLRKRKDGPFSNLNQDDEQASRTLFVGNLPGDVREAELKRVFEMYGTVEDIDIKILDDSNAAYAFILFHTVEEAIEARQTQHNKPMRPGSNKCKIGYGKTQASAHLYVGSLGPWATADMLMKEFDRYGPIESIVYENGNSCAYVCFYRVFGKEHLLQDILRDDSGNALKLAISQRLPLDNNFYQKMIDLDQRELALMVAVEGSTSVEPLMKYLQFFAPRIAVIRPGTNHLLIALRKAIPDQSGVNSASLAMANENLYNSMNNSLNSSSASLAAPPQALVIPKVKVQTEPGLHPASARLSALLEKDYRTPTFENGTIKREPSVERDDEDIESGENRTQESKRERS
ncbi:RNA recognition motif domain-containing protein [Ditylenchus destructor]|uniref:RNA recognition motif domain-containing protein n=1 Tax=Ditylenchus destructor TaxID=166010 RepID=A0AAD4MY88_9BILA|nr:RNA recognition motif domain-containing protein [Ditylenchus destructor]